VQESIDELNEASDALLEHEILPKYRQEVDRTLANNDTATNGLLVRREKTLDLIEAEESTLDELLAEYKKQNVTHCQ